MTQDTIGCFLASGGQRNSSNRSLTGGTSLWSPDQDGPSNRSDRKTTDTLSREDPSDQIIVATTRVYECLLVTSDDRIVDYPHVQTV